MSNKFSALIALSLLAGSAAGAQTQDNAATVAALAELASRQADDARIAQNLDTFDTLDFEVFTHQQWDRLHETHAQDIVVHLPDGTTTTGLEPHIQYLDYFFSFAPDTRIEQHPIRFGQGEWTGVVGVIEGTFSQPMHLADGSVIEPTGLAYSLTMATIGHWTEEGVMDEEYLFWDNQSFYRQIGLGQ
ncbi:nuclear transport factor 2 family protein [Pararhodobacter sp. CCB-MM2]|uniref:nuclear transport factor 2 family protein n=1 Tax=Pararhodobacter sp. CCB-MM2 TaxID=1786003 RepID=UPI00082E98E1|nr:nuclear transport factor 2 family protein [Pararhodobacter sp. CCB-MM2]